MMMKIYFLLSYQFVTKTRSTRKTKQFLKLNKKLWKLNNWTFNPKQFSTNTIFSFHRNDDSFFFGEKHNIMRSTFSFFLLLFSRSFPNIFNTHSRHNAVIFLRMEIYGTKSVYYHVRFFLLFFRQKSGDVVW